MVAKKKIEIHFKVDEIEAMRKVCSLMTEARDATEKIDSDLVYEMHDISLYLNDILSLVDKNGHIEIEDFNASS